MQTMHITNSKFSRYWSLLKSLLQAMLFGGMLSLAFLDGAQYYLTWFAFIPLLFAVERASFATTYLLGLAAGLSLFISGTYWIQDFIIISKGYGQGTSLLLAFAYWLYCAHLIAFLLLLFKWLKDNTEVHEFLLFPIVVSTFTSAYPMLFAIRLGESQVQFLSALQAIEFVGVYGLDAIIALFNIIMFRFLCLAYTSKKDTLGESVRPWMVAISVIALWFIYGLIHYSDWEEEVRNWDTIKFGMLQPNEIPTLGKKVVYPGYSDGYPPEMEMTERLSNMGAEIVIWPEAQYKDYLDNPKVRSAYQSALKSLDTSIVFQDIRHISNPISGKPYKRYNSAVMLDQQGQQIGLYQKIKRIPFGEYIPLISDDSDTKSWLEDFLGEFLNEIAQGEEHQVFIHREINILPLICYETTFPAFVGNALNKTSTQRDKSKGSIMVGLTNDGWFGSTHQPYQHIVASVLRAVENRMPLVHVANNGPSIVVSPSGKLLFTTDFQKAGGYIVDVPHSSSAQGSFYSQHPQLFTYTLYLFLLLLIIYAFWTRIRKNSD